MDIRPIRNEEDYTEVLREIERLWGSRSDTPDGDKLDILVTLAGAYEDRHWPIVPGSPRDILEYAVTEMGRSQKELAGLLNSRSQASDVLTGKRRVSLNVAHKISLAWHIPIQLLVAPYPEVEAVRRTRKSRAKVQRRPRQSAA